ncbi:tRNA (guanosine(37)-N1)-methyltransferase TrmD [Schaalia vaccimaxillae]|uniref:tRNA (guanosine(37)-N1)-methyltransferase TrmD n=1 Tax=Schaalia vaccimaxillae TaxID=183916 RepID=UPI0003B4A9E5|nr:tRNA (guanosine(37)-N1)-methyltransferase TrmD [Schaalia vaccimaxillae]
MRIDLVTIFPDYFAPLELSLMGKASDHGLVDVNVHDLRNWTSDRHRSVDDTPYGGGAGMVMKPDVWGQALDEILATPLVSDAPPRRVLAIPTPSGRPLTQEIALDLASADQLIVACGRYEGPDQRVADYYHSEGCDVLEYSIGDYVLNGGEAAALVLVEAVVRLLDGFMGNPDSIVEESYSDGLLEYPAYTKPRSWRGFDVPDVLLSGDHEAIRSWRLEQSLERTVSRRPDLILAMTTDHLNAQARQYLASRGYAAQAGQRAVALAIEPAHPQQAQALSALARATFPMACPEHLSQEAIDAFMTEQLSVQAFERMLADPDEYRISVAQAGGQLVGYTLTLLSGGDGIPADMVESGRVGADAAYLSKCYVDSAWQGSGIAGALLEAAIEDIEIRGRNSQVLLGTNEANKRAQKFYRKHGFMRVGRRVFNVGGVPNRDVILVRKITPRQ